MQIAPFGVEQWMNEYETRCRHNLAETCCDSITVEELLALAGHGPDHLHDLLAMKLTYGAIEGSDRLRSAIAALYENQTAANALVTHGAIGANQLVYLTLVEPGDHVVSVVPSYQQHTSIPESIGATVTRVPLREEAFWQLDVDELVAAITPGTKVVALTNPNNPTGALLDRPTLQAIADACERVGAWLLCDEVYRGIDQQGSGTTASVVDLSDRAIAVGSMSKAFSLAGLRLGWIAGPADFLHDVTIHRDYNTISVGMIDDHLAALALEHAEAILGRNRALVRANLDTLAAWVDAEPRISWTRPQGGTVTLLRYDADLASREFCVGLVEGPGSVMLTPGSALGMEGFARIGFGNSPDALADGLPLVTEYLNVLG
ncbi:MAG: aminotransferase class I/II-fold pyridoxal phosphate-dependent enzyme [Actinomycetota bacterium]